MKNNYDLAKIAIEKHGSNLEFVGDEMKNN